MKHSLARLVVTLFFFPILNSLFAGPAIYTNPVVPEEGYGADPGILDNRERDGYYYLFATHGSANRRFRSAELVNWEGGHVMKGTGQAPQPVRWDDDTLVLYTNFGVSLFESPVGANPPKYRKMPGLGFDPDHFRDTDGTHYLMTGGMSWRHQIRKLSGYRTPAGPAYEIRHVDKSIDSEMWYTTQEGAVLWKHGEIYYLFQSVRGGSGADYRIAWYTSDSPFGPFESHIWSQESCFLRRSDYEEIYGPGHFTLVPDDDGVIWMFYQQKETEESNWLRKIALDPLWFDSGGVPHIRPTRGKERPGPNSGIDRIWPLRDPSAKIEAESYDGSAVVKLNRGGTGEVVENLKARAYLAYRRVNFGDTGARSFQAYASSGSDAGPGPDSQIEVRLGGVDGPLVAVCPVDHTGGWGRFQVFTCGLAETVTGVHDVFLVFQGHHPDEELMKLDAFTFAAANAEENVAVPRVVDDTIRVRQDRPLEFNVLANNPAATDGALTLTGVSQSGWGNRVDLASDGTVTYHPGKNRGMDRFAYAVRNEAGLYARGEVMVRIAPASGGIVERSGHLVFEAEDFAKEVGEQDSFTWVVSSGQPGFSGTGYVTPSQGAGDPAEGLNHQARLVYPLDITTPGHYHAWVRARSSGDSPAGFHFNFHPRFLPEHVIRAAPGPWQWIRIAHPYSLSPGLRHFVLIRHDGNVEIDKVLFTTDPSLDPSKQSDGKGPEPSPRWAVGE